MAEPEPRPPNPAAHPDLGPWGWEVPSEPPPAPLPVSTKRETASSKEKAQPDSSSAPGRRRCGALRKRRTTCRTGGAASCRALPAGPQTPALPRDRTRAAGSPPRRPAPTARRRRAHDAAPPPVPGASRLPPGRGRKGAATAPPPCVTPRGVRRSFPAHFPEQRRIRAPMPPPDPADAQSSSMGCGGVGGGAAGTSPAGTAGSPPAPAASSTAPSRPACSCRGPRSLRAGPRCTSRSPAAWAC